MAAERAPFLSSTLRLEQRLGSGAMGEVWRAHSLPLDAPVAVKVLHQVDSDVARARFEQEARAAARIGSPHVVRIYDCGVSPEGLPFIVMELLSGRDLRDRLTEAGPMTPRDGATVIEQACRAVDAAHAMGVIHRDIKPANLFLVDVGGGIFVKLVDFGVAKHLTRDLGMTETGTLMGTPYYMSPEQLLSPRSVDHRCDLWSLAVVAYACLAGTVPFHGETLGALSIAIHQRSYARVTAARADLPQHIDRWFEIAFHPAIESRFQSAAQLAATFAEALAGRWPPVERGPDLPTRPLTLDAAPAPWAAPAPTLGPAATLPPAPPALPQPIEAKPRASSPRTMVIAVSALVASLGLGSVALWLALGGAVAARGSASSAKARGPAKSAQPPSAQNDAVAPQHPRRVAPAALEDRDDDPEPIKVREVRDHRRFDVVAHARESMRWATEQDPGARLVAIHASAIRADGTVNLDPLADDAGGAAVEVYSPKHQRCWHLTPLTSIGVYAQLLACSHELTGELPSCSAARILERAYRGAYPKGVALTYSVDVIGRREWSLLDDDSSDRHTITDDCR